MQFYGEELDDYATKNFEDATATLEVSFANLDNDTFYFAAHEAAEHAEVVMDRETAMKVLDHLNNLLGRPYGRVASAG